MDRKDKYLLTTLVELSAAVFPQRRLAEDEVLTASQLATTALSQSSNKDEAQQTDTTQHKQQVGFSGQPIS